MPSTKRKINIGALMITTRKQESRKKSLSFGQGGGLGARSREPMDDFPQIRIEEGAHEYTFRVYVPDCRQENVRILISDRRLYIFSQFDKAERVGWKEKGFCRVFSMPDHVCEHSIESAFHKGVLTFRLRKGTGYGSLSIGNAGFVEVKG